MILEWRWSDPRGGRVGAGGGVKEERRAGGKKPGGWNGPVSFKLDSSRRSTIHPSVCPSINPSIRLSVHGACEAGALTCMDSGGCAVGPATRQTVTRRPRWRASALLIVTGDGDDGDGRWPGRQGHSRYQLSASGTDGQGQSEGGTVQYQSGEPWAASQKRDGATGWAPGPGSALSPGTEFVPRPRSVTTTAPLPLGNTKA